MKTSVFLILALILISEVSAVKMRSRQQKAKKTDVQSELKNAMGKSDFSDHVLNSILLSMEGGKTDEVIKLITEAINNTKIQLTNLNNEKAAKIAVIDTQISQIQGKLSTYRTQFQSALTNIEALQGDIKALNRQIEDLNAELSKLRERVGMIQETRKQDIENFQKRQERDANAIQALEQIIPMLKNMLSEGSFIQKSQAEIDEALKKIPKNHPIEILVQMSSKFNEAKLRTVVGKLEDILIAIRASTQEDKLREGQSEGRFKALIIEANTLIDRKTTRLVTIKNNVTQKSIELNNQETQRDTLEDQIKDEETSLTNAQELRTVTETNYNTRINETQEAIDALRRAKGIIEEGSNKLNKAEGNSDAHQQSIFI